MKLKLIYSLIFLFIYPTIIFSQNNRHIQAIWDTKVDNRRVNSISLDSQVGEAYNRLQLETPEFNDTWEDTYKAQPNSLKVYNIKYTNLAQSELALLNKSDIPNEFKAAIKSSKARDIQYTSLSYSPIVKNNSGFKKVISFDITYDHKNIKARNNTPSHYTNEYHSIFATGEWFKFEVDKTGIYKIDGSFLSNLGVNLNNLDPTKIKIYGHGGNTLPLSNSTNAYTDPPEVPIKVITTNSKSFSKEDYFLFFAQGTKTYNKENDSHINPYSDKSYYYIRVDGEQGKRITAMDEPSANASHIINTHHRAQFYEEDLYSPAKVGRRWFGNRFDVQNIQEFNFKFPNRVPGSPVQVIIKTGAVSSSHTNMEIHINQDNKSTLNYSPINAPTFLITQDLNKSFIPQESSINIRMQYNNNGNPSSVAYLDYIRVISTELIKATNEQELYENIEAHNLNGVLEYQLEAAQNIKEIWDVSDPKNVRYKTNNASQVFKWKVNGGKKNIFASLIDTDYYTPQIPTNTKVDNQNIKGTIFRNSQGEFEDIDYLIISSEALKPAAERLASHHKSINNLNTKVVTTEKIYQEFSSGKQDISAIRNLVRYVYNNASIPSKRIQYLALFGDTSVDYKDRWEHNNNIVPSFHTLSSTSNFSSYVSDDFFGMMDEDEGQMAASDKLDIAVGRIIADKLSLAQAMVTKIIDYQTEASYGDWRNNIVTISDDVDKQYEFESIQTTLNQLSDEITNYKPSFNVKKILSDSYIQRTTAGGNRYPEVNQAIRESIENGALMVNYFGHGGEDGLAHEYIYTQLDAKNLKNKNRYPLFVTVTCEFTKFDYPERITAGELTYWNKEGGAISLITTTRAISVPLGVEFNLLLIPKLLAYKNNSTYKPAEALRRTKNEIGDEFRRTVFYIGDPALSLAQAQPNVELTHINEDLLADTENLIIRGLDKVKFSGQITNENGDIIENDKAIVSIKLFDKDIKRKTLGNDGVRDTEGNLLQLEFTSLGEILFNGQASVQNGRFDIEFIVPKDIKPEIGTGKLSFYYKQNMPLSDRTGYYKQIKLGGINPNAKEDKQGPEIKLYLNNENFISGESTSRNPNLLVKLYDESGINTSGGIGHDIIAYLSSDPQNTINLNEYYQANIDDFTSGTIQYPLKDLEVGPHSLHIKAWDVYNNSSEKSIDFYVQENDKIKITKALNYPNPFVNYTEFWFEHNKVNEPLEVLVQVQTITGKIVWHSLQTIISETNLSRDIIWDGRDDFGEKVGKGVYIYKISIKSTLTNERAERIEKLVIL